MWNIENAPSFSFLYNLIDGAGRKEGGSYSSQVARRMVMRHPSALDADRDQEVDL